MRGLQRSSQQAEVQGATTTTQLLAEAPYPAGYPVFHPSDRATQMLRRLFVQTTLQVAQNQRHSVSIGKVRELEVERTPLLNKRSGGK